MPRLLLLVALVALLLVVLKLSRDDEGGAEQQLPGAQQTGYYLRDALVTEYGEDGRVRLELAARSAIENPATHTVELEQVSASYFALPEQSWRLTSDRGNALPAFHIVELQGNVVMTGHRQSLPQPAIVRTEQLTLNTTTQQAQTDSPVTLGLGPYALAAIGLRADLKAETLQLESRVNGNFLP